MSSTFRTHRHDAWVLTLALFDAVFVAVLFTGGVSRISSAPQPLVAQVTPPPAELPEQTPYQVTNFNGSGPGSLRDAVLQSNRYVYFTTGGTINITNDIDIKGSNITIEGFAQSPGVTLSGAGLRIRGSDGAHSIIIRNIRVRNAARDGIQVAQGAHDVRIENVSIHGSADGNLDITGVGTRNVTVEDSIIVVPRAGTEGDDAGDQRNMLLGNGATEIHLYNNIIGFSNQRNPEISFDASSPFTIDTGTTVDMRNNIIWDWTDKDTTKKNGERATRVEFGSRVNVINNLFGGVADALVTKALTVCRGGTQDQCDSSPASAADAFTSGNVTLPGNVLNLNTRGNLTAALPVVYDGKFTSPHGLETACIAASSVKMHAGLRPLDSIDQALLDVILDCPAFNELFIKNAMWEYGASNSSLSFKVGIYNHGNVPTPVTSGTLKIDGEDIATLDVPPIPSGRVRNIKLADTHTLSPGAHTLRFCVDMGGAVTEPDEANNCIKGTINAGVPDAVRPAQADLVTNRFLIKSTLLDGQAKVIGQGYVYNQGLTSSVVAVPYEFTIDGIQPTTPYRPRVILPGTRAVYKVVWRMPTTSGKHTYAFHADPTQVISEANETNNNVTGFIFLVDVGSDIFPTLSSFSKSLTRGTRGAEVKNMQQFLFDQLVFSEDPTGYYGVVTQAAVREFQKQNELPETGTWDDATRAVANELEGFIEQIPPNTTPPATLPTARQVVCPTVTLTFDMWNAPRTFNDTYSGGQVSALQEFLWQYRDTYEWNLKSINKKSSFVTGAYNTQTANAVEFFQQQFGIFKKGDEEFGKVYQKTRDEILRQCGALAVLPNTSAPDASAPRAWGFADILASLTGFFY